MVQRQMEETPPPLPRVARTPEREAVVEFARRTWVPFARVRDERRRNPPAPEDPQRSAPGSDPGPLSVKGSTQEGTARDHGRR
eukprot:13381311-Heterocapsa_arctica.AAC.1